MTDVRLRFAQRLAASVILACGVASLPPLAAQQTPVDRLPLTKLDVTPPSARVVGEPGSMRVRSLPCRTLPATAVRQRLVDVAVQEWGYFGFIVLDQTEDDEEDEGGGFAARRERRGRGWGRADGPRVAASIAGYWSVTPEGSWIVANQNRAWNGENGAFARWEYPWSAAFISWVMCEAGLGETSQFQRAVAHHTYIDQAIRASGASAAARAAYVAREPGETSVRTGDLLCTARRPEYQSLAERRRQMGQGARTHCDLVVKVDEPGGRILAIGGNVRGSVSLKILAGVGMPGGLRPARAAEMPGGRAVFAHLALRTIPLQVDAFDASPTLRALGCADGASVVAQRTVAPLVAASRLACGD
jgi:hypothetical protein